MDDEADQRALHADVIILIVMPYVLQISYRNLKGKCYTVLYLDIKPLDRVVL